jgi:hypothetical protein
MALSYCAAVRLGMDARNTRYHETEYGFPLATADEHFERPILEMNRAGLSWLTSLKERDGFRRAYRHIRIDPVAAYGGADCAAGPASSNRPSASPAARSSTSSSRAHRPQRVRCARFPPKSTGCLPGAHYPDCPAHYQITDLTAARPRSQSRRRAASPRSPLRPETPSSKSPRTPAPG